MHPWTLNDLPFARFETKTNNSRCMQGIITPPSDLELWHNMIAELAMHLVDRYGATAHEFLFEVGPLYQLGSDRMHFKLGVSRI
jgi:hypothetical protein